VDNNAFFWGHFWGGGLGRVGWERSLYKCWGIIIDEWKLVSRRMSNVDFFRVYMI